ncbi:MAG: PAS domain S-box protein [Syntrophales bacterium LBB04]|nr:PAS domain S-box protein [Syntrophales bacterium LBB04]
MNDPCRNDQTPIKERESLRWRVHKVEKRRDDPKKTRRDDSADLRRRAEEMAREKDARLLKNQEELSPEETKRTLHELRVHQIELMMQNEELRRVQAELEAAQARYFNLYDLAPVGYCTVSEKGLILEANLTAATLLGVERGALIRQPIFRFILKEDQDIYYRHRKLLFETGEQQACELRMLKQDGTQFWAHLEATAAQDADGTPVFRITMSDNPERKRAEEALRESEANFRNMAEQLVDVLFATDDSSHITFVSPSALQMFGWKPEEMVGRSFIEFLPESEIPGAVTKFKDAMASGKSVPDLFLVMKRKDESTFPGEMNSSVIWKDGRTAGVVGIIRDITERKRAAEALKESEERYRNQVEAINDVAFSISSGGEITYISPVVRNLLGYEADEITGRHFLEFVHQEDHDLLTEKFSELREGMVSHGEYRVIGKSGDVKWVRSLTSPILDIGGFVGGRGIIVDITEHKRAEVALHGMKENFRRSLDESPLGVRIVTAEGETIYANPMILDIYGYDSIEELNTTPIQKRYTRKSYDEFLIRRDKRRQGFDVAHEYTIDIIRKDGDVRHLRVFRKEILWDDERQYQVIYQDITEHRRAAEALVAKSGQLEETNTALRVLLQHLKDDQQKTERRITANIRKLVLPNLEKLRGLNLNDLQASCLDIVTVNLQQVTSPFLQNLAACFADFTPREIQVANMIRHGKTSKEIADIFHTSIRNVDFHRDNIRKKLGLNHQKSNLRTFLMKLSEE